MYFVDRATQRATQRAARWPSSILDKRRTDGSSPTCMEQENDDKPSLEDLRNPVQLSAHVRAREVR